MTNGIIFDIKEFTVHDGPGIRTTVFLKGCPLDCAWCHNPEGKSREPQVMRTPISERQVGREFTPDELAERLNAQGDILRLNEGGVTFSGGEPLMQAAFVAEVMDRLVSLHILLDTSGYANQEVFIRLAKRSDLVFFDLKIMDPVLFKRYTRGDIRLVLSNLRQLNRLEVPFVIRVPLIPGVTDTEENLAAIAGFVQSMPGLLRVDLLPYNRLAGAKYAAAGLQFQPVYDETIAPNISTAAFEHASIPVRIG